MPNHVTHRVRLHGSEEDCKRFYEQFFRDGGFDFETVLPQPECVKRTQSGPQASVVLRSDGHVLPSECRNGMPTLHQWGWVPRHLKTAVDVEKWLTEKDPKGRVFGEYAIQCLRKPGLSRGTSGASIIGERSRTHIKPRSCLRQSLCFRLRGLRRFRCLRKWPSVCPESFSMSAHTTIG